MAKKSAFPKWLKTRLAALGADVSGGDDAATHNALRDIQAAAGLPQTGLADAKTIQILRTFAPAKLTVTGTAGSGSGASISGRVQLTPPMPNMRPQPQSPAMPQPQADMSGPGGSPASQYPPMPSPQQDAQYWQGDISQPPPWSGGAQSGTDISSGNSPLAGGVLGYQPPNDPAMPPTQMEPQAISQGMFDSRFGGQQEPQQAGMLGGMIPPEQAPQPQGVDPGFLQQLMAWVDSLRQGVGMSPVQGTGGVGDISGRR